MSERIQRQRVRSDDDTVEEAPVTGAAAASVDYESLLDDIDAALQGNAEEYVRGFVQKGGQ